jgi:cytochrome P450
MVVEHGGSKVEELAVEHTIEEFNAGMGADGDASPYPLLAELRSRAQVHPGWPEVGMLESGSDGPPLFTAYSYDAVRAAFMDGTTFSSRCYESVTGPLMGRTILEMDEPEHRLYRQLQQQAFARSAMDRWEVELVRPLVERTVDRFRDAGRADLVHELFLPVPVRVIAALLGLPETDVPEFHRLAISLIGFRFDMDGALRASTALRDYFAEILADRRRTPRDDMVTVLAEVEVDGVGLTDDEIFGFLRNLLPAGAETTSRSSASLAFALLTHPEQLDSVRADHSLLPQAIEEGIRWETPLLNFMRLVTRDTDLGGVALPGGATLMVNIGSANHDETRWDDPECFNIFRERRPHMGFGHGAHQCLGMHLARLETTVMFTTLINRLPGLRIDPDAPRPYVSGTIFRSPSRLDAIWG